MVTSLTLSPAGGEKLNSEIMLLYRLARPKKANGCAGPTTKVVGLANPWVESRNASVFTEMSGGPPAKPGMLDQSPAAFSRRSVGVFVTNGSKRNCITLADAVYRLTRGRLPDATFV